MLHRAPRKVKIKKSKILRGMNIKTCFLFSVCARHDFGGFVLTYVDWGYGRSLSYMRNEMPTLILAGSFQSQRF